MIEILINTHQKPIIELDFTAKNLDLDKIDLTDTSIFTDYVFNQLLENNSKIGIGGYFEHRVIYRRSGYFNQVEAEPRCIHLGLDIWNLAGTEIYAPMDGIVHSFANNNHFGDYGPTIILQHNLPDKTLYTLYGHLSLESLDGLFEGKTFKKGEQIATFGDYPINGDWPPHLHFQVMNDMLGMKGDFAGVCAVSDMEKYQEICLDPMEFLRECNNDMSFGSK
jgi:peptidoglycan LD-endopeptidase LytH